MPCSFYYVPALSHVSEALSLVRADLISSPKRVKDSGYLADVEVDPREISLRDDVIVRVSDEPHLESDIDPEIHVEIDKCFAYADALRDRWIDARVVVETVDRDETETGVRGLVKSVVIVLTERVAELERDNRRLKGTASVESQRVDRLQRGMARMQRELRQIRRKMPNTRSGASRTREAVNEQSDRRMAEALRVRDAVRNLRPLMGDEVKQEEVGGNGNGGNGDRRNRNEENGDGGNRNGGNGNRGKGNGNGGNRNGVIGLTHWFEKMEIVFHISNCPEKYQVKYASCTLLNSALTWWNSHKRTIGNEAAYAMSWA
ncbi:hypothetical protein Tco_1488071 [Tanacetum coccineum]